MGGVAVGVVPGWRRPHGPDATAAARPRVVAALAEIVENRASIGNYRGDGEVAAVITEIASILEAGADS